MKTNIRKIYQCDYCQKYMLSAGAMSRHEKFCRYKPENKHKCFDQCRFLIRKVELIEGRQPGINQNYKTIFICKSTGRKMYSYLLEKRINFKPSFTEGLMRMPVACNMHAYMTDAEIEKRYNIEL